jgi:hypothetical protein
MVRQGEATVGELAEYASDEEAKCKNGRLNRAMDVLKYLMVRAEVGGDIILCL